MKFRKKPVVIEAVTWNGKFTDIQEWPDWFIDAVRVGRITIYPNEKEIIIFTLEGEHLAHCGDMIIRGVQGELYSCRPDIFAATYEAMP